MSFDALRDFANQSNREIGNFRLNFILSPDKMRCDDYGVEGLHWDSIHFGDAAGIERIPNDKRGVYALTICHPSRILPLHGYIIYIGIAGRRSNRPLRERYRDYLRGKHIQKRRPHLAYAIGTWQNVLRFCFAPVDDGLPTEDLERLEKNMNTALMPPYSFGDLETETKRKRKAFP